MNLLLIRHTSVNLPKGICYGFSDVPLANGWEEEADDIAQRLVPFDVSMVYSSPLSRCRLLAEKISNQVMLDDRLKELNFGTWELMPWNEITGPQAEKWMNDFVNECCPEGESYMDMSRRIGNFLDELKKKRRTNVVIVSHAGVIRTILALIQKIPLQKSFEIEVSFGQIMSITLL